MSRKRKPGARSAGHKSNHTAQIKPDLQKSQSPSPWANEPEDNWLEATCADDAAWFDANPARQFHIREATPHERFTGLSDSAVLVVRLPDIGRARFACEVNLGKVTDYDRDAIGEILFAEHMRRTDPVLRALILDARKGARHG